MKVVQEFGIDTLFIILPKRLSSIIRRQCRNWDYPIYVSHPDYFIAVDAFQTKGMRKTQELQPQLKALQQNILQKILKHNAYSEKEQQRLYAE